MRRALRVVLLWGLFPGGDAHAGMEKKQEAQEESVSQGLLRCSCPPGPSLVCDAQHQLAEVFAAEELEQ